MPGVRFGRASKSLQQPVRGEENPGAHEQSEYETDNSDHRVLPLRKIDLYVALATLDERLRPGQIQGDGARDVRNSTSE